MRQKTIRFSGIKIRLFESQKFLTMQLNFGRYKKGRKIDTWTLYDAISEKHKPLHDEIWLDIQDKKAIGMSITVDKTRNSAS
jgi:hypothetical protein